MAAVQCRLFAVAGLGAFVAFMVQDKGWPYQFLPAKSLFLISAGIGLLAVTRAIAGRIPDWGLGRLKRLTSPLAVCVALAVTVGWTAAYVTRHHYTRNTRVLHSVEAYLRNLRAKGVTGPFAALSVSLFPAFPLTERLQAEWGMRFSCLWPLPSIIKAEQDKSASPTETGRQFLMDSLVDDFERWKPGLVLVQETYDFPMVGELVKDPRFAQQWRRYRLVGEVEYFQVFERAWDDLHATGVTASSAAAAQ